jgi:F0F1-type ATP synthase assembly protein I
MPRFQTYLQGYNAIPKLAVIGDNSQISLRSEHMPDPDDGQMKNALLTVGDSILGAAVLIMLGTWGGSFLDQKFQTTPWLSITLAMLGAGLGLARLVIKAIKLNDPPQK